MIPLELANVQGFFQGLSTVIRGALPGDAPPAGGGDVNETGNAAADGPIVSGLWAPQGE